MTKDNEQFTPKRQARNPKPRNAARDTVETEVQRVRRLYAAQGGPLTSWLIDEARRRGQDLNVMARELGVTYGYIAQLRNGFRSTVNISPMFSSAVARYLGVPEVVVMVVCGRLGVSAFVQPALTEEQAIERALGRMLDDSHVRAALPVDVRQLPFDARKALVALYCETADVDLLGAHLLPRTLQYLQRAAVHHETNEFEAQNGHADTDVRGQEQQQE
jgi:hypothetical protein